MVRNTSAGPQGAAEAPQRPILGQEEPAVMPGPSPGKTWALLMAALLLLGASYSASKPRAGRLRESLMDIWGNDTKLDGAQLKQLRREAWEMFDHGFSNYIQHAAPKDNLLPISCTGEDWQGGLALTLIDALDTLLLMNRRSDMQMAVELLRHHLSFDKDIKVHVFETVIRVLGGLLSGHVMLARDPSLVPGYDGLLLHLAVDLTDRLLPAFDTPSGLPTLFVNLRTGRLASDTAPSCTACAGTLLLEFGLLSNLTGNPVYMKHAHHCAKALFDKRSRLGLVGSSWDVFKGDWASRETSIGPGSDSYYEYLLKAYLMFGDEQYLDWFAELYGSTMKYTQLPISFRGYSFLVDVQMDTGRLSRHFVSSLGAFWPAMQALIGQEDDAAALYNNYTGAWHTWGWMPELFSLDVTQVHQDDPGYNLRPEHVESTYLLHCLTGDDKYLGVAARVQRTLAAHNRALCGFAAIRQVATGEHQNLQESFFLSELMKYLYLTFSNQTEFINAMVLSTEGHCLPVLESPPPLDTATSRDQRETADEAEGDRAAGSSVRDGTVSSRASQEAQLEQEQKQKQQQQQQQQREQRAVPDLERIDSDSHTAGKQQDDGTPGAQEPVSTPDRTEHGERNQTSEPQGPAGSGSGDGDVPPAGGAAASGALEGAAAQTAGAGAPSGAEKQDKEHDHQAGSQLEDSVPANCEKLCREVSADEQRDILAGLRTAFPLLHFKPSEMQLLRQRRCRACIVVTHRMRRIPRLSLGERAARLGVAADQRGPKVLSQVVCVLQFRRNGQPSCNLLRPVAAHDVQHGLPSNAVVMQLSLPPPGSPPAPAAPDGAPSAVVMVTGGLGNAVSLQLSSAPAAFGAVLGEVTQACLLQQLHAKHVAWEGLSSVPNSVIDVAHLQQAMSMHASGSVGDADADKDNDLGPCVDRELSCWSWAVQGECAANPEYMLRACPRACQLCDTGAWRAVARELLYGPRDEGGQTKGQLSAAAGAEAQEAASGEGQAIHGSPQPFLTAGSNGKGDSSSCATQEEQAEVAEASGVDTADAQAEATSAGAAAAGAEAAEPDPGPVAEQQASTLETRAAQVLDDSQDAVPAAALPSFPTLPPRLASTPALCQPALLADSFELHPETAFESTAAGASACSWPEGADQCLPDEESLWSDEQYKLVPPHAMGPCKDLMYPWGPLVLVLPVQGCGSLSNADKLHGAIAVVMRGNCSFVAKTLAAQDAGAVGVVVVNNARDAGGTIVMSDVSGGAVPHIPAVLVSHASGRLLQQALRRHAGSPRRLVAGLALLPPGSGPHRMAGAGSGAGAEGAGAGEGAGREGLESGRDVRTAESGQSGEGVKTADTTGIADSRQGSSDGTSDSGSSASSSASAQQGRQSQEDRGQCRADAASEQRSQGTPASGTGVQQQQPQIDMLVPPSTHPFLQAQMLQYNLGSDLNQVFRSLLQDGRATSLLMSLAQEVLNKQPVNAAASAGASSGGTPGRA